jgi:hypothetical protein
MRRRFILHLVALILAALAVSAGCARRSEPPDGRIDYLPDGAVVTFKRPVAVKRLDLCVEEPGGGLAPVVSEELPDRPLLRHRLFFPVEETPYRLFVETLDGARVSIPGVPGPDVTLPVGLLLQVPYTGEADVTERWGRAAQPAARLFPPGAEFTVELEALAWRSAADASLELTLGRGLELASPPAGWTVSPDNVAGTVLGRPVRLACAMDVAQFIVRVRAKGAPGESVAISARLVPAADGRDAVQRKCVVRIVPSATMEKSVRAVEVLYPTSAAGAFDLRRPRDTVVLSNPVLLDLRRRLGISSPYFDYYAPSAHETLVLENASDEPLPVAVTMRTVDARSRGSVAGFRPPDYLGTADAGVTTTARLEPHARTGVPLPVYVRPGELLAGDYLSIFDVRLLGTDAVVAHAEHALQVRAADLRSLAVTAAAVVMSVAGLVVFLVLQRRIFRVFRVSELVLIALFASMTFVLVIFPGSILGPVFTAVAGPFGFLIQGVFFEAFRVAVLVTLLVLVPRPGTVTLVSLVRYLIGGLIFGGFTPVDLFYLGPSVVLMEAGLWLGGITSKNGLLRRREFPAASFLYVALVLGLANAATQYVTYCLNITLYRLYFADWFIALAVIVNGFLYAMLGAIPGLRLGRRLRRVSE